MEVSINLWAVLGAAVSVMVIGSLWYGLVFRGMWRKMMGFTKADMKSMPLSPMQAMFGGLITALLMAYVLAHFADAYAVFDIAGAWELAFWVWLGFAVPFTAGGWLWEGKPFKLFVLNAAHWLALLFATSVIVGLWR